MITPYNILRHELVGLEVKAVKGSKSVTGYVDAETSKTLKVKTPEGVEKVVKDSSVLEFKLPKDAVVRIEGGLLAQRPEDRIKKRIRIRF